MSTEKPLFSRGWSPAILWMLVIFTLSSMPGSAFPKIRVFGISGIAHTFEYWLLGVLLLRSFLHSFPEKTIFMLALLAAGTAILFGISDEFHQLFVPGRCSELGDVIVDAIAAILGILLYVRKTAFSPNKK